MRTPQISFFTCANLRAWGYKIYLNLSRSSSLETCVVSYVSFSVASFATGGHVNTLLISVCLAKDRAIKASPYPPHYDAELAPQARWLSAYMCSLFRKSLANIGTCCMIHYSTCAFPGQAGSSTDLAHHSEEVALEAPRAAVLT